MHFVWESEYIFETDVRGDHQCAVIVFTRASMSVSGYQPKVLFFFRRNNDKCVVESVSVTVRPVSFVRAVFHSEMFTASYV